MKLKFFFFILSLLLVAVWGVLLVLSFKERGMLFYMVEGIITFSLIFLIFFYRKVIKPLDTIGNGMDLLREQDFSSRLTPVGQKEADRIVLVFNRMMEQLKDERLRLREQNHFLDLLVSVSPMGLIILTLDGHVSMINAAALRYLDYVTDDEVKGRLLCELTSPLAEEIERIPKDASKTVRLSDSMIYRCSRLSFVDRGFAHPFILIESLTSEVVKAEKKAYEKVIRMIAHEVNKLLTYQDLAYLTFPIAPDLISSIALITFGHERRWLPTWTIRLYLSVALTNISFSAGLWLVGFSR